MPELPDLVYVERVLQKAVAGRSIVGARTGDPLVLRIMTSDRFPGVAFPELLVGRRIESVRRRGHFMCFALDGDLVVVVNAMLAGRFMLAEPTTRPDPRALALALVLGPGDGAPTIELRYVDEKRMGKVYVAPADKEDQIPVLGKLGVEVLSDAFTLPGLRRLIAGRRDQVRQFLMDKETLASIGNAYADEILFAARIHPKTFCNKLAPGEVEALFAAIRKVMLEAIAEIARRAPPVEAKVRDFLSVRGRDGKPCRACGTTIRAVRVGDGDACFCPSCQPTSRKLFVDFSKLPGK